MAIKRRVKRRVTVKGQETPAERQMRTAVRVIMDNVHYETILKLVRAGTPNTKIAEWAIMRGYADVNQKTFVGYLQYFRKAQPNLCKPQIPADEDDDDMEVRLNGLGYDHLFDGNKIVLDEELEMLRLIKLQQARLGISFKNERQMGIVLADNRREVEELRNLIMDLAKLRGLVGNNMSVSFLNHPESVKDDLKGIQQDEKQRNTIASLVTDLIGTVRA